LSFSFLLGFVPLKGQNQLASYLSGHWQNTSFNHTETWIQEGNTLRGFGLALDGNDTLFYERLEINLAVNPIVYTSWVTSQNDGTGIEFKLTESTDTSWIFENPQHDFPTKIIYIRKGPQKLEARVSGREKGIPREEQFVFEREKK
jgi:hypothetical protein